VSSVYSATHLAVMHEGEMQVTCYRIVTENKSLCYSNK